MRSLGLGFCLSSWSLYPLHTAVEVVHDVGVGLALKLSCFIFLSFSFHFSGHLLKSSTDIFKLLHSVSCDFTGQEFALSCTVCHYNFLNFCFIFIKPVTVFPLSFLKNYFSVFSMVSLKIFHLLFTVLCL